MSMNQNKATVAIGSDFLTAFSTLPKTQQKKVSGFLEKFRFNPVSGGIHYEKINGSTDPNVRSVRIDDTYRGIVLHPEGSGVYLLLWVDHHDEAYDWAKRRRFCINSHTGAIQIVEEEVIHSEKSTELNPKMSTQPPGLFADIKDKHLLRLGIPELSLPLVRSIQSDEDLEGYEQKLPQEAAEALYMLAMGYDLQEVFAEQEKDPDATAAVDTADYQTALVNADTQRRFHVVEGSMELAEILNAPLDKWRVFLHPNQRKIVTMKANGPVRVLGGAGTGKTVVAMHRAKYLAEKVFSADSERILFTTFTRNLAEDIKDNLSKICSVDTLRRIEVVNLDGWVSKFLKQQGYESRILTDNAHRQELWERAVLLAPDDFDLPISFYRQEWTHVIQAQAVSTEPEYMRASRVGRGQRLSRLQRKKVWPVFEEYRALLNREGLKEFTDALRNARIVLEDKGDILNYQAVVVDEAQDFSAEAFRLVRQIIPPTRESHQNNLFIVGDAHQRIYAHRVVLGQLGIEIRGRSRKLRLNYRTTDEVRRWSVALLRGVDIDDLDGGKDDNKGYKSLIHGPVPELKLFKTFNEEVDCICDFLSSVREAGIEIGNVCLTARTQSVLGQFEAILEQRGVPMVAITAKSTDNRKREGMRTATMHRVKGLEFDVMIIAGLSRDALPLEAAAKEIDSPHAKNEFETRERSLLYVNATRARRQVLITASGTPSPFLPT